MLDAWPAWPCATGNWLRRPRLPWDGLCLIVLKWNRYTLFWHLPLILFSTYPRHIYIYLVLFMHVQLYFRILFSIGSPWERTRWPLSHSERWRLHGSRRWCTGWPNDKLPDGGTRVHGCFQEHQRAKSEEQSGVFSSERYRAYYLYTTAFWFRVVFLFGEGRVAYYLIFYLRIYLFILILILPKVSHPSESTPDFHHAALTLWLRVHIMWRQQH